jgi:hypothetical protein
MTRNSLGISCALLLSLSSENQSAAQSLVSRSFDVVFEGDDPGEVFAFDLPFDPLIPSVVRFDGLFENLTAFQTSVRYGLLWRRADGSGDIEEIGIDFTALPGSGSLPIQFDEAIGFTPDLVYFHIEGGGPADHFRFTGEFSIQQVPEPHACALLAAAAVAALARRRSFPGRPRQAREVNLHSKRASF